MAIGPAFDPPSQNKMAAKSNRAEGKLLLVGEQPAARRAMHVALFDLGFDVGEATSREEAIALCGIVHYDAVLMDLDTQADGGVETCTELRRLLPLAVIVILGVRDDQEQKLKALEAGADDCLTKPFHMRELAARIRAALRRSSTAAAAQKAQVVKIGELSLDPARHLVQKAGRRIHLTPREFDLLSCLMMHPGMPVAYGRILHTLWGDDCSSQIECLRTFVRQLRKKIEDDPGAPRYVLTEGRFGYRFTDPDEWRKRE